MKNKFVFVLVVCLIAGSVSVDASLNYDNVFENLWENFKSFFWYGESNNLVSYGIYGGGGEQMCVDSDLDTYSPGVPSAACPNANDCDDGDNDVYPGAVELCDGKDNQCPGDPGYGQIDEGFDEDDCSFVCQAAGYNYDSGRSSGLECCGDDPNENNPYETLENICNDNNDNDCDGLIDCADDDCNGQTGAGGETCEYPESTCNDGDDNDADGLIDCADHNDCDGNVGGSGTENCASSESYLCGDGFDNDADGTSTSCGTSGTNCDCDDVDCANDPACSGSCPDTDNDNYNDDSCGGNDCDDSDATVNPAASEVCNDNVDNDCDGDVDCADSECQNVPNGCETFCSDGLDNDGDGDCDDDGAVGNTGCSGNPDSDCATSGGTGTEDCTNKIDDNGNCPGDTNGDGNSCNMGDTGVDCLDLDCAGPPPETQCYGYPLHYCDDDTDCTSVFGAETFCDTDFGTCDEGPDGTGCDDGQDNDGDGYVDCSDWGCSEDSTSSNNCAQYYSSGGKETDIVDGCIDIYDNDFDGYTDCVDGDCASDPACASGSSPSEDCSDGLDNDGDGYIDCNDWDCYYSPSCAGQSPTGGETSCTDSLDNDGDGDVDCADSDCASSSSCVSAPSGPTPEVAGPSIPGTTPQTSSIPGLQAGEIVLTPEQIIIVNNHFIIILPKLQKISNLLENLEELYKKGGEPLLRNEAKIQKMELEDIIKRIERLTSNQLDENQYSSETKIINSKLLKSKEDLRNFLKPISEEES